MAPKQREITRTVAPIVVNEDFVIEVRDVSVEASSGWREVDGRRVQQLVDCFLAGDYGVNILRKPSLLQEDERLKLAGDGLVALCDGKHTFAALRIVQAMYENEATGDIKWSQPLVRAITIGVNTSVVEFKEPEEMLAFCVAAHDIDSNKFKATSIKNLVEVARKYQLKIPGGDWKKTQQALQAVYGSGKRTFVYRMMQCAMGLPDAVLEKLQVLEIPNSYVHENPYFLGHGAEQQKRMRDATRLKSLDMLREDLDLGRGLSAKVFVDEYCSPLKLAEKWVHGKRVHYGALADIPAFKRVE